MKEYNEKKFLKAYDDFADAIFRHCYFRVYDRERARDLMQDTFIKTWEYLARGNEIENLRAFLYRVANNLVIDNARKKKPVSLESMQEDGFQPAAEDTLSVQARIDAKMTLALLARIDKKHRDVIIMRYIDELSPKEIAEIIGETQNNVSVRLHRALGMLRKRTMNNL